MELHGGGAWAALATRGLFGSTHPRASRRREACNGREDHIQAGLVHPRCFALRVLHGCCCILSTACVRKVCPPAPSQHRIAPAAALHPSPPGLRHHRQQRRLARYHRHHALLHACTHADSLPHQLQIARTALYIWYGAPEADLLPPKAKHAGSISLRLRQGTPSRRPHRARSIPAGSITSGPPPPDTTHLPCPVWWHPLLRCHFDRPPLPPRRHPPWPTRPSTTRTRTPMTSSSAAS